ncbi:MAG: hypothetical protein ACI4OJ_03750 [Lachnospiraceae bacterium]
MKKGRYLFVSCSVQGPVLEVDLLANNYGHIILRKREKLMSMPYPGPAMPQAISFEHFWAEHAPYFYEFEVMGCGLASSFQSVRKLLTKWGIRLRIPRLSCTDLADLAGRCLSPTFGSATGLAIAAGIAPVPHTPDAAMLFQMARFLWGKMQQKPGAFSDREACRFEHSIDTAPALRRRRRKFLPARRGGQAAFTFAGKRVVLVGTFRYGSQASVRRALAIAGAVVEPALRGSTDLVIVGSESEKVSGSAAAAFFHDALRRCRRRGKPQILSEQRVFPPSRRA